MAQTWTGWEDPSKRIIYTPDGAAVAGAANRTYGQWPASNHVHGEPEEKNRTTRGQAPPKAWTGVGKQEEDQL